MLVIRQYEIYLIIKIEFNALLTFYQYKTLLLKD